MNSKSSINWLTECVCVCCCAHSALYVFVFARKEAALAIEEMCWCCGHCACLASISTTEPLCAVYNVVCMRIHSTPTHPISKSIMSTMYKLNADAWRFMSDTAFIWWWFECVPKTRKAHFSPYMGAEATVPSAFASNTSRSHFQIECDHTENGCEACKCNRPTICIVKMGWENKKTHSKNNKSKWNKKRQRKNAK